VVFSGKDRKRPLQVVAKYSDGASRVVNQLALYLTNNKNTADIDEHGVVTGGKRGDTFVFARFAKYTVGAEVTVLPDGKFKWPKTRSANYIDDLVYAKLQKLRMLPSAIADDEQYLRRAYLDTIGLPPATEEYRRFMADRDTAKRAKLIEALLTRDEFADLWATKWSEWLKIRSDNNSAFGTDRKAAAAYYDWIREQMRRNTPLDQFVKAQVAGAGSNLQNPPVDPDVERPTRRESAGAEHAIRARHRFSRIAQNREVDPHRLSELAICFRAIDAGTKECDVELTKRPTARADRFAFGRTSASESFGEPRDHSC
jgi:hypothetical protein